MSKSLTTAKRRGSGLWETSLHMKDPRHDSDSGALRRRGHSAPSYVVPQTQDGPDRPYRREWSRIPRPPLVSYPPPPNPDARSTPPQTAADHHHVSYGWNHSKPPWTSCPDYPHRCELSMRPEPPSASYLPRSSMNVRHQRTPPSLDPHARFPSSRINHYASCQPPWMSYPDPHRREPSIIPDPPARPTRRRSAHTHIPPSRIDHRTASDWNHPQPPWSPQLALAAPWYDDTHPPPHTYGRPIPLPLVDDGDFPSVDYADAVRSNVKGTGFSRLPRPASAECRCSASAVGTSGAVMGLDARVFGQRAICDCDISRNPERPSSEGARPGADRRRVRKQRRSVR